MSWARRAIQRPFSHRMAWTLLADRWLFTVGFLTEYIVLTVLFQALHVKAATKCISIVPLVWTIWITDTNLLIAQLVKETFLMVIHCAVILQCVLVYKV